MKKLKAPYGYGYGIGVKLINTYKKNKINKGLFCRVLLSVSCPPPIVEKIYSCLIFSGEYTCYLQADWFCDKKFDFEMLMDLFGIEVEVFFYENIRLEKEASKNYFKNKKEFENLSKRNILTILRKYMLTTKSHFPELHEEYKRKGYSQ